MMFFWNFFDIAIKFIPDRSETTPGQEITPGIQICMCAASRGVAKVTRRALPRRVIILAGDSFAEH